MAGISFFTHLPVDVEEISIHGHLFLIFEFKAQTYIFYYMHRLLWHKYRRSLHLLISIFATNFAENERVSEEN